ncbi:GNAT family N-acetyltransferase [Cohnella fermenti]|uniref:GNAT family N-acetyltransferase n=1 Tax=Cohnella fermenti TaxID=2565925 RepID=A0A4S4BSI5_9BACL|nr:GNAT family N-acetyltransferase [Cohnella fermenti]THF75714.1 GNAT family N-acetyltransferase [Cohnella fermenti]
MKLLPTPELIAEIERSEIGYLTDHMRAIEGREGNPEGIEIRSFGQATAFCSRTMPWPSFNTVKGLTASDIDRLEEIAAFYAQRQREVRFEIVPSRVDSPFLGRLAELGFHASGFHASMFVEPEARPAPAADSGIRIEELGEDGFELYASIHCRGFGMGEQGIPHVARNNKVLHRRPGWTFLLASLNDIPAAVGVLYREGDVASLTFAATLPEFRRQGLHGELLNRRIAEAFRQRCRLVVAQCGFLSPSHRDMERAGMRLGYVRSQWTKLSP